MPVALRDYQSTTTCVAESAESITRLLKSPNTGVPVNHTQNGAEQVLSGKILNGVPCSVMMLIKLLQLTAVSASMRHANTTQGDRAGDTDTVVLLQRAKFRRFCWRESESEQLTHISTVCVGS